MSLHTEMKQMLDWLEAAGVDSFNFAVLKKTPKVAMLGDERPRDRAEVEKSIGWAWHCNKTGDEVYIRPARIVNSEPASWPVIFFDDVPPHIVNTIATDALIVRTSENLHHVWLKTNVKLTEEQRKAVQVAMCDGFEADRGSVSGEHFGRAAGFKNNKRGGNWIKIVKTINGAALDVNDYLAASCTNQPFPQRGACTLAVSPTARTNSGFDESARTFGYVCHSLKFARNFNDSTYQKMKEGLIYQQTQRALERGKRQTEREAQKWVEALVEKAERSINF